MLNAPLAGTMFAIEELYKKLSPLTLICVLLASVTSTVVTEQMFGIEPLIKMAEFPVHGLSEYYLIVLAGVLAGQQFSCAVTGEASLRKRPMNRVAQPLRLMGAQVTVSGGNLKAIDWHSTVASAQVKSAILLAGLYADGDTSVTEPVLSRNHTELMLRTFGATVVSDGLAARLTAPAQLEGQRVQVPGDISSAAFFMAAAAVRPQMELRICSSGLNPTRTGIIDVLRAMGAVVEYENVCNYGAEVCGDIVVRGCGLHWVEIGAGCLG